MGREQTENICIYRRNKRQPGRLTEGMVAYTSLIEFAAMLLTFCAYSTGWVWVTAVSLFLTIACVASCIRYCFYYWVILTTPKTVSVDRMKYKKAPAEYLMHIGFRPEIHFNNAAFSCYCKDIRIFVICVLIFDFFGVGIPAVLLDEAKRYGMWHVNEYITPGRGIAALPVGMYAVHAAICFVFALVLPLLTAVLGYVLSYAYIHIRYAGYYKNADVVEARYLAEAEAEKAEQIAQRQKAERLAMEEKERQKAELLAKQKAFLNDISAYHPDSAPAYDLNMHYIPMTNSEFIREQQTDPLSDSVSASDYMQELTDSHTEFTAIRLCSTPLSHNIDKIGRLLAKAKRKGIISDQEQITALDAWLHAFKDRLDKYDFFCYELKSAQKKEMQRVQQGFSGEEEVLSVLRRDADIYVPGALFYTDVNLLDPVSKKQFENDIIIVHESGIYALEVKNYSMPVTVNDSGMIICKTEKSYFESDAVAQCQAHVDGLCNILSGIVDKRMIHGFVIIADQDVSITGKMNAIPVGHVSDFLNSLNRQNRYSMPGKVKTAEVSERLLSSSVPEKTFVYPCQVVSNIESFAADCRAAEDIKSILEKYV